MFSTVLLGLLVGACHADFVVNDPSNIINPAAYSADNALIPNFAGPPPPTLLRDITGPYVYRDKSGVSLTHDVLSVNANDTSVVVIANGSNVTLNYATVIKKGYSSNLYQASFYGVNAAVNVANASSATLKNVNITVHNGAANVYAYGASTVKVSNAWLYSSGPVSHGLYASTESTIRASNVYHYSGGRRSSSFAGDAPAGYIYITDAVAHTDGIGSAICYNQGLCHFTNVIGHASNAPFMFSDGGNNATFTNCDLTGSLLAGTIIFSSMTRETAGPFIWENSKITAANNVPALWFGNVIATAQLISTQINATGGVLVVANYSQVTQDFDYYADYTDNPGLQSAEATITVEESQLTGDLVAYNKSSISWSLSQYSSWTGKAYVGYLTGSFAIALDKTSNWTLTGDTTVQSLVDADKQLNNILSGGHTLYYNKSVSANSYLNGKTISLSGGGKAVPYS